MYNNETYYQEDDSYFEQYDNDMADVVAEADYYYYRNDSLLELVRGVQTYLLDQYGSDSPLHKLQYKLHRYVQLSALDFGTES